MIQEVPVRELLDAWSVAYRLVAVTGRWPVLVTAWGEPPELRARADPFAPTAAEMSAFDERALAVDPWVLFRTRQDDQRRMYERVLADADAAALVRDEVRHVVHTDHWYTPDNVSLLLLPTASGWAAPNWVDFFGAAGRREELAAVLWQWERRWGARLVACWDTMLHFVVERPPTPGDEAWAAAGQIKALARNLDLDRWKLAVALPGGDAWFIHNRP